MTSSPPSDCYCKALPEDAPSRKALPPGFCGLCDVCGAPGHTRAHPGGGPFTGAWCQVHYEAVAAQRSFPWGQLILWSLILVPLAVLLLRAFKLL